MARFHPTIGIIVLTWALPFSAAAQSVDQLTPHRVKATAVDYQGKHAVKVVEDGTVANGEAYAVVAGPEFHDGTIEVEMAGRPAADDECVLVEGDYEQRRFVVAFRRGQTCTGVLGVSRPRHVMQGRMRLVESLDWQPIDDLFAG